MSESKEEMVAAEGGEMIREYRKGNWTLHETMVLITAKKMDNERRMKREIENEGKNSGGGGSSGRPTELRWKWVEDYCWRNGCMRSQNQCNDRWDNLMRDSKKVKEYERRIAGGRESGGYWKLERHERKERNLPSNLLLEIYEALAEVVERRGPQNGGAEFVHEPVVRAGIGLENQMVFIPSTVPQLVQQRSPTSTAQPPTSPPPLPHAGALPLLGTLSLSLSLSLSVGYSSFQNSS